MAVARARRHRRERPPRGDGPSGGAGGGLGATLVVPMYTLVISLTVVASSSVAVVFRLDEDRPQAATLRVGRRPVSHLPALSGW